MLAIKLKFLLFLGIIQVCVCQRRIKGGEPVSVSKNYMVYLVKAPLSVQLYDTWLCGGALVSSEFVITSAACVNDVDFIYVIAGYDKYVRDSEIDTDKCTKEMKKKVIYSCYPKKYQLKYDELDYWSFIDIALAKVESPYDFTDVTFNLRCSYIPNKIEIGYESRFTQAGSDAIVLGWGHKEFWRKEGDVENYNEDYLNYAPLLILNKTDCMSHYTDYANMSEVIESYMICTLGKGDINDRGNTISNVMPDKNGCTTMQQKVLGFEGISCEAEMSDSDEFNLGPMRRDLDTNKTYINSFNRTMNISVGLNMTSRRQGICQNDHGGPLVTWVGSHEILIGVASVFKVSDDSECIGPYLYTSTHCTSSFLSCVLTSDLLPIKKKKSKRTDECDLPADERGYETVEKHISWKHHPAGPAVSELLPQNVMRHREKKNKNRYVENVDFESSLAKLQYEQNNNEENQNQGIPETEKNPGSQRDPVNQNNPINQKSPVNQKDPANQKNPVNKNYKPQDRYGVASNNNPVQRVQVNNVPNAKYGSNQKYALRGNYPINHRNTDFKKFAPVFTKNVGPKGNARLVQRPQQPLPK